MSFPFGGGEVSAKSVRPLRADTRTLPEGSREQRQKTFKTWPCAIGRDWHDPCKPIRINTHPSQ